MNDTTKRMVAEAIQDILTKYLAAELDRRLVEGHVEVNQVAGTSSLQTRIRLKPERGSGGPRYFYLRLSEPL